MLIHIYKARHYEHNGKMINDFGDCFTCFVHGVC